MKRRSFLKTVSAASLGVGVTPAWSVPHLADQQAPNPSDAQKAPEHASPETILLKDYRPKSLYKIPVNQVPKAKYPIIDMHSHAYAKTPEEIAEWVKNMDEVESRRPSFLPKPRDKTLPMFNGNFLRILDVSRSGAALITAATTSLDSALRLYAHWKSAIRQAQAGLVNSTTKAKGWFRAQ